MPRNASVARILVVLAATLALSGTAGCSPVQRGVERPRPEKPATDTTRAAGAFDPERWNAKSGSGHTLAAARDIIKRGLLENLTIKQVGELLGPFKSAAIPADYVTGPAEVSYKLNEGPELQINFEDRVVDKVDLWEPAGDPDEALKLAGDWRLESSGIVRKLELRKDGKLVSTAIKGAKGRYLYRWQVTSPAIMLLYDVGIGVPDRAAFYRYRLTGDVLLLTWLDRTSQQEYPDPSRPVQWTPWLTGGSPRSLELRRWQ